MRIKNLKCYKPTRTKRIENERWHQMMDDRKEEKSLTDPRKLNIKYMHRRMPTSKHDAECWEVSRSYGRQGGIWD